MKPGPIVGAVAILGALAFGASALVTNLTPYLTFSQARVAGDKTVQVMGALDKSPGALRFDGALNFVLVEKETGQKLPVRFGHTKPANFENAVEIVAIGQFDGKIFQAENLLVKCPSKYQGTETKSYAAK